MNSQGPGNIPRGFVPPKVAGVPGYGRAEKLGVGKMEGPATAAAASSMLPGARGGGAVGRLWRRVGASTWGVPVFLAGVFVAFLGSLLFTRKDVIFSHFDADLTVSFGPYREFFAEQVGHGHIPLWNPHTLCGTPFVGNFQSAVFYPLTWIHLVLPFALAINWTIAIEMFLAGWFTAMCCRQRGVGRVGAILAGLAYVFSGPVYLRLYSGNLALFSTMTWAPLVLLCIDRVMEGGKIFWGVLGGFAGAMMILAGAVPNVYNMGLVFGVYVLARLIGVKKKGRAVVLLGVMGGLAISVSAVQLLPGLRTAGEAVRAGGTSYEFSKDCPVPPENLVTMIAPGFWGDVDHRVYMGRWNLWESTMFMGMGVMVLAGAGMVLGRKRGTGAMGAAIGVAFLLALGVHAHVGGFNLFRFMFDHFPMYDRFRAVGRFAMFISLFVAILAGMGIDELGRGGKRAMWAGMVIIGLGILVAGGAWWVWHEAGLGVEGKWAGILQWLQETGQSNAAPELCRDAKVILELGHSAAWQLWMAAGVAGLAGGAAILARRRGAWGNVIALVAAAELMVFVIQFRATGAGHLPMPAAWATAEATMKPGERVLHVTFEYADVGMATGVDDIYGYEGAALKRYCQLLAATQKIDPDSINFVPPMNGPFNLLKLMRCRYVLFGRDGNAGVAAEAGVLPRVQLIDRARVISDHLKVLAAVTDPKFDAVRTVVLEEEPRPAPVGGQGEAGAARIVRETTDSIEITAELNRPAVLLISDAYSRDWRAAGVGETGQGVYEVLPGDYAFRAVALGVGRHHFVMRYEPVGFVGTVWVTCVFTILGVVVGGVEFGVGEVGC